MCLTNDLSALHRLAWAYLAPAYLLSLVLASYGLSRFYRFRRIFSRFTCIRMFWQFILLSFCSLSSTSFQLIKCVSLYPEEVFKKRSWSNWRFADDPSHPCFAGEHLPWAIIAVIMVAFVCIPLPLSLPFLRHYHLFIPISDIYSSLYKDNRRWWCSVDLLRRLLFAAIYTGVDDPDTAHFAMIQVCFFLIFLQALVKPFASSKANIVELSLLLSLTLITHLGGPDITRARAIATEAIFFTTLFLALTYMVWEDAKLKNWKAKPKPAPGYAVPALGEEDDGTMLRDRLLADIAPNPTTEE